jgi:hypothetical protein
MIEQVPAYVSITFLITSFVTVLIFISSIRRAGTDSFAAKLLLFVIPAWMIFHAVLAYGGFYLNTDAVPPRLFLYGVFPALAFVFLYLFFARKTVVEKLPLAHLTLLHTIRIPVELVLSWLFAAGLVPEIMTFHGNNFDILSGITAPIIYLICFRGGRVRTKLLAGWNILALLLLINIVLTAVLCMPLPIQKLAFDQPNVGLFYFPYIWLPTVIVPIVLFCHLASLWKIFRAKV